ncbi:MAG: PDDEXK nuclease domain-containing protein, partial [Elusimicrobiota bacterium]
MNHRLYTDKEYKQWLADIKAKVRQTQIKASVKVNTELLSFYWGLGSDIVAKQSHGVWGDKLIDQLSKDLISEFPDVKGFSRSNLMYVKKWYLFYNRSTAIVQQPVGQLKKPSALDQNMQRTIVQITQIPWGHNIAIISKCKNIDQALYYVQNTITHNWSRSVLVHQMDRGLDKREGKSINNFTLTLPKPQSDLAVQVLKDPYVFDFLAMTKGYNERELENALTNHVTQFLMELGAGFSYIGKQVPLQVGAREFFIDLLFYHTRLHAYV